MRSSPSKDAIVAAVNAIGRRELAFSARDVIAVTRAQPAPTRVPNEQYVNLVMVLWARNGFLKLHTRGYPKHPAKYLKAKHFPATSNALPSAKVRHQSILPPEPPPVLSQLEQDWRAFRATMDIPTEEAA